MLDDFLHLHPIRDHRRRILLAEPISPAWRSYIEANVAHYSLLSDTEKHRLEDDARVFVAEKTWEGGGWNKLTDEMKITIAAQACLLLVGWDDARRADLFPNVQSIIVYPSGYHATGHARSGYVQSEEDSSRLGEAWASDLPVVLSWRSALDGAENDRDGHNVVLHEFAHKLDMMDGRADGVPRLSTDTAYAAWAAAFSTEFADLRHDAEIGYRSLFDHYGATNEAEFFAVATEAFFEKSERMQGEHPDLYAVLRDYFQQDPAARLERFS